MALSLSGNGSGGNSQPPRSDSDIDQLDATPQDYSEIEKIVSGGHFGLRRGTTTMAEIMRRVENLAASRIDAPAAGPVMLRRIFIENSKILIEWLRNDINNHRDRLNRTPEVLPVEPAPTPSIPLTPTQEKLLYVCGIGSIFFTALGMANFHALLQQHNSHFIANFWVGWGFAFSLPLTAFGISEGLGLLDRVFVNISRWNWKWVVARSLVGFGLLVTGLVVIAINFPFFGKVHHSVTDGKILTFCILAWEAVMASLATSGYLYLSRKSETYAPTKPNQDYIRLANLIKELEDRLAGVLGGIEWALAGLGRIQKIRLRYINEAITHSINYIEILEMMKGKKR